MADSTHSTRSNSNDLAEDESTPSVKNQPKKLVQDISSTKEVLSRINESYHQSKADQIYRLLIDQENLNKRFNNRPIPASDNCEEPKSEDRSDDSLSESSMKETEKRLAARLSLHKQRGGRSKTSMGFHNDAGFVASSDEDEDTDMIEEERQINTRVNRPKSSYIRRRTMHQEVNDATNNSSEICDDTKIQRTSSFSRPQSRRGMRGVDVSQQRRMVLKETSYNHQQNTQDEDSPPDEFSDSKNYDQYANTRYASPTPVGLARQRSRVRSFCENDKACASVNLARVSQSKNEFSNSNNYYSSRDNCQEPQQTTQIQTMPLYQETMESADEVPISPIQKHRRQQLKSAKSSRPTSENVYMVRQRTESRLTTRETISTNVRPKSDKLLLKSSSNKAILSIDTNPNKSASPSRGHQGPQSGIHSHAPERYSGYSGKMQGRPITRSKSMRADVPGVRRSKNVTVYGARGQPIGVMKLPPLDPPVSQRVDRSLVIAPNPETVV